jgi:tetratricopeptide (TPR) repeat protein
MSMDNNPRPVGTPMQPNLSSLLARYIQRQAAAHADGLASAGPACEVVPHDVGPVQPVDARPAWQEAIAVAAFYGGMEPRELQAPPQWPHLVAAHEPETALPFCFGNFPQLVRNFQALVETKDLAALRPTAGRSVDAPALLEWASQASAAKQFPRLLLALGALRLAKQFEAADEIVRANDASVRTQWRAAWASEKAALAWQRGQFVEARSQWDAMAPSVPVHFNRGMAALFCGQPAEAQAALSEAVKQLPDTSAWHHLGQLYLALPVAAA